MNPQTHTHTHTHTGPPQLLSPVSVPAQTAGKTHLEISLNISANPGISYTLWKRNGKDIVNDTHILPRPDKLTFTSLLPTDNGSYTAEVFNSVGNLTIPFDVIVTSKFFCVMLCTFSISFFLDM